MYGIAPSTEEHENEGKWSSPTCVRVRIDKVIPLFRLKKANRMRLCLFPTRFELFFQLGEKGENKLGDITEGATQPTYQVVAELHIRQ